MGQGAEFLDDATEKNMEALESAKQATSNVEKIASKPSQTAQTSGKDK